MNAPNEIKTSQSASVPSGMSEQEWQTRLDLAACYRLIHHHGWTTQVFNHITARIPDTEHLLINPFGLHYDEITASNLLKIDIEGNLLEESEYFVNRAGYVIHSAIHMARPDLQCTLHTHSENAEAVSCLSSGFIPMTQNACIFHDRIGYHDYEGVAVDEQERQRLIADLGNTNHTLILRNHGVLIGGDSIACAYSRLYDFENGARAQLKAMATGDRLVQLPEAVLVRTRDQFEAMTSPAGGDDRFPQWPAALRMLDRVDPGWRS